MADLATKFASTSQEWETPETLFGPLHAEFGFTLDAAATEKNAKADLYIDRHANGLTTSWGSHVVWVNPPFGDRGAKLVDWVRKARRESEKGATVVMLIPARTNTNWFHDICLKHGEVRFVRGRPKFVGATEGLPQPLCLVIFRPAQ